MGLEVAAARMMVLASERAKISMRISSGMCGGSDSTPVVVPWHVPMRRRRFAQDMAAASGWLVQAVSPHVPTRRRCFAEDMAATASG